MYQIKRKTDTVKKTLLFFAPIFKVFLSCLALDKASLLTSQLCCAVIPYIRRFAFFTYMT